MSEPKDWSAEGEDVGLKSGDWVSVTPDDYGNPVHGLLLAWKALVHLLPLRRRLSLQALDRVRGPVPRLVPARSPSSGS